jgi:transmembrane sensor
MNKGRQPGFAASASAGGSPAGSRPAHPLDWPANAGAVGDVLHELNVRLEGRRRRRVRMVAGVLAAFVLVGVAWHARLLVSTTGDLIPQPAPVVSFPRQQTLPDGSLVDFRNDATIAVRFSESHRHVVLERGEAHFAVAKDESRPFVVRAGATTFRAVGTAFAVHLAGSRVEMIVTEGLVAVSTNKGERRGEQASDGSETTPPASSAGPSFSETIVEAGNHVVVDVAAPLRLEPTVRALTQSQLSHRLAWRAPRLEFSGTPLVKAVEMINEHSAIYRKPLLILGDASLASVRISGILRADNIDTLIGVLEADYGIRAEHRGETEIVLHAR